MLDNNIGKYALNKHAGEWSARYSTALLSAWAKLSYFYVTVEGADELCRTEKLHI